MRETPPHSRSCGCLKKEIMRKKMREALDLLRMYEASRSASP